MSDTWESIFAIIWSVAGIAANLTGLASSIFLLGLGLSLLLPNPRLFLWYQTRFVQARRWLH